MSKGVVGKPNVELFNQKIDRSPGHGPNGDCWIWTAAKDPNGYGRFGVERRTVLAHRVSYEINKGPVPEGLFVLHECDNPQCVNPSHLTAGTQVDNMRGCHERGRANNKHKSKGDDHHLSKLTTEEVLEMRRLWALGGITKKALGEKFGVTPENVAFIVTRRTWKHV